MIEMTVSCRSSVLRHRLRQSQDRFIGILCMMVFALCSGCASAPVDRRATPDSRPDQAVLVEKLGVKPVAIRLTAASTMLDFRYKVVDPEKSLPAFDRKVKTYLIDQASGDRFDVPAGSKLGPLRSSSRFPEAGKEYFIFFANSVRNLQRGSKVTVVIGDFRIEDLTVE